MADKSLFTASEVWKGGGYELFIPAQFNTDLCPLLKARHNTVKHSGVKRIEVQLTEQLGEINLVVSDSGRGFDVAAAMQGKGLGLTSMRARAHSAGEWNDCNRFTIDRWNKNPCSRTA